MGENCPRGERKDESRSSGGRWLATRAEDIFGVGRSPAEAYRAAKWSRFREEPSEYTFVPDPETLDTGCAPRLRQFFEAQPLLAEARRLFIAMSPEAYVVGGFLRDMLLGRPCYDMDIALRGDALAIGRQVADALGLSYYPLDENRGMARLLPRAAGPGQEGYVIDVVSLQGEDIHADLARRDFTVNALAADLRTFQLLDLFAGLDDLRERRIRLVSSSAIQRDPVRALRAVRLSAQLGFGLDREVLDAIARDAAGLRHTSVERIRDELNHIVDLPHAAEPLGRLMTLGLWEYAIPELVALVDLSQSAPHKLDVWEHTLLSVTRSEAVLGFVFASQAPARRALHHEPALGFLGPHRDLLAKYLQEPLAAGRPRWSLLKWAALLHDVGKPQTRQVDPMGRIRFDDHDAIGSAWTREILRQLHFSGRETAFVAELVRYHSRPMLLAKEERPSRRAMYRFFRATGDAGLGVLLLSLADILACAPGPSPAGLWAIIQPAVSSLLDYYRHVGPPETMPRLVSGDDVKGILRVEEGRAIGQWLERVREEQAAGVIASREEALEWLRDHISLDEGGAPS